MADPVRVRFLGSGDAFGSGGRFQTCIRVEHGGAAVLLDCGASSLVAMKRFGVDPASIDAMAITHLHGDHFGGIPFFVLDAQFNSRRERPLLVAGPPGVEDRVRETMEALFPRSSRAPRRFELRFVELAPGAPIPVGPLEVSAFDVVHFCGSPPYALRLRAGDKVIAYSGDTEWTEALLDVARGADLFVCEAYFYEKAVKFHLDYRTLARHRDRLGCKRLVITHMNDDLLARLGSLEVEAATDGAEFVL